MTWIIGHVPAIPPEPKYAHRLEGLHRPEAKWTREADIPMTIGEILDKAKARGYYLCYMGEWKAGHWHARFERVEFEPGKTRTRDGSYAVDPVEAVYSAFEEIENPGINHKRHMDAVNAKWASRSVPPRPLVTDPYELEKLLRDDLGLALRLEDAVRGLLYSLTGEDDEDDVV